MGQARAKQERSVETRARLLEAAADVIARHGIEGASVDAISSLAERTSGSLYGQFGSKDALIVELLDVSKRAVAAGIEKELATAESLDDRLAVMWRNFVEPPPGAARDWIRLEHELLVWATRPGNDTAQERLKERYRSEYDLLAGALGEWADEGLIDPPPEPRRLAAVMVATLLGLEMSHRLDPAALDESTAVGALRALLRARQPKQPR